MSRFLFIATTVAAIVTTDICRAGFSFTPLGRLPGGSLYSAAYAISADGSVVVGGSSSAAGDEAFRWTAQEGLIGIGALPADIVSAAAYGVSANGAVIIGVSVSGSGDEIAPEAFRWTDESGMGGLGFLSEIIRESWANGVSADGAVVVGYSDMPTGRQAFRWTADDGMVGLGDLLGAAFLHSEGLAVSADGNVVVGGASFALGYQAFRWTADTGMVGLGDLPDGPFSSVANAASADGSVIVGTGNSAFGAQAFLWTAHTGMLDLREYLLAGGAEGLAAWTLTNATGISADGRTIVGWGINPEGVNEAWVATVPEPSTLILLTLGGACLIGTAPWRRRPVTTPS